MLREYSISEIIISNPKNKHFYVGTFEGTENPKVDWPHRHDFYSLTWFTKSSGINVIDFEEFEIRSNRIFLMRPRQVHNWSYAKESKGFTLVLANHLVTKETINLFNTAYIDLPMGANNNLRPLLESLILESKKNDKLSEDIVLSGISHLLFRLKRYALNESYSKKVTSKIALKFSKMVSETISENLPIMYYATNLNLTPERLIEICQKSFGQSPKSIILNKKMTDAKRLLYFTEKSIGEVAYEVGFDDSSYFSRIFKRKTGISPSRFKSTR